MTSFKRPLVTLILLALGGLLGTACGDDDDGTITKRTSDGNYYYDVGEVRHDTDVYRCINNRSTGAMWCENIGLGGNG